MALSSQTLVATALELAVQAGKVANFCDHVEHNEATELDAIREAGVALRARAFELSRQADCDAIELYASRLAAIESRNVLSGGGLVDAGAKARAATTWRALQLVQAAHDRAYHPDVVGMAKLDQLRHYALHLAKLAGVTAGVATGDVEVDDWLRRRVPDMLLFGIKLATVSGEKLPERRLPQQDDDRAEIPTERAAAATTRQ